MDKCSAPLGEGREYDRFVSLGWGSEEGCPRPRVVVGALGVSNSREVLAHEPIELFLRAAKQFKAAMEQTAPGILDLPCLPSDNKAPYIWIREGGAICLFS